MSTDDSATRQALADKWLGFDQGKPTHEADYDCTLDDLVASLLSNKRTDPKFVRLVVSLPHLSSGEDLELFVLVRSLTQIYAPMESFSDPQVIEGYYEHAEWSMDGWIKRGAFNPSFTAPSVRCFFHSEEGGRLIEEAEVQFLTQLDLT